MLLRALILALIPSCLVASSCFDYTISTIMAQRDSSINVLVFKSTVNDDMSKLAVTGAYEINLGTKAIPFVYVVETEFCKVLFNMELSGQPASQDILDLQFSKKQKDLLYLVAGGVNADLELIVINTVWGRAFYPGSFGAIRDYKLDSKVDFKQLLVHPTQDLLYFILSTEVIVVDISTENGFAVKGHTISSISPDVMFWAAINNIENETLYIIQGATTNTKVNIVGVSDLKSKTISSVWRYNASKSGSLQSQYRVDYTIDATGKTYFAIIGRPNGLDPPELIFVSVDTTNNSVSAKKIVFVEMGVSLTNLDLKLIPQTSQTLALFSAQNLRTRDKEIRLYKIDRGETQKVKKTLGSYETQSNFKVINVEALTASFVNMASSAEATNADQSFILSGKFKNQDSPSASSNFQSGVVFNILTDSQMENFWGLVDTQPKMSGQNLDISSLNPPMIASTISANLSFRQVNWNHDASIYMDGTTTLVNSIDYKRISSVLDKNVKPSAIVVRNSEPKIQGSSPSATVIRGMRVTFSLKIFDMDNDPFKVSLAWTNSSWPDGFQFYHKLEFETETLDGFGMYVLSVSSDVIPTSWEINGDSQTSYLTISMWDVFNQTVQTTQATIRITRNQDDVSSSTATSTKPLKQEDQNAGDKSQSFGDILLGKDGLGSGDLSGSGESDLGGSLGGGPGGKLGGGPGGGSGGGANGGPGGGPGRGPGGGANGGPRGEGPEGRSPPGGPRSELKEETIKQPETIVVQSKNQEEILKKLEDKYVQTKIDEFKANYATRERTIQKYGGELQPEKIEMDRQGLVTIKFNRDLVYNENLVSKFMPNYKMPEIKIEPSFSELEVFAEEMRNEFHKGLKRELSEANKEDESLSKLWSPNFNANLSIQDRFDVKVIRRNQDDNTLSEPDLNFQFEVVSLTERQIQIQVNFTDLKSINSEVSAQDFITMKFNISDIDPTTNNEPISLDRIAIPRIIANKDIGDKVSAGAEAGTQAVVGSAITTALMTGALAQVWSMLNGLQLFVHFPLLRINFPTYTLILVEYLVNIAGLNVFSSLTLNYVTEDLVFSNVFGAPEEDTNLLPRNQVETGYESSFLIVNLGTMFFAFIVILCLCLLSLICKPIENISPRFRKIMKNLKESLYWNTFIRFLIEGCLEIALSSAIQWYNTPPIYEQIFDGNFRFNIVNKITMYVLLITTSIFPIFILVFYLCKFKDWKDDEFEEKFGAAYENMKKDRNVSIFFTVFFILRRFAFVASVFYTKAFWLQIIIMIVLTMVALVYLLNFRPFSDKKLFKFEVFNELILLIQCYLTLVFSDANTIPASIDIFDFWFIGICFSYLFVHIVTIFWELVKTIKKKIKKCKKRQKKKEKKEKKKLQKAKNQENGNGQESSSSSENEEGQPEPDLPKPRSAKVTPIFIPQTTCVLVQGQEQKPLNSERRMQRAVDDLNLTPSDEREQEHSFLSEISLQSLGADNNQNQNRSSVIRVQSRLQEPQVPSSRLKDNSHYFIQPNILATQPNRIKGGNIIMGTQYSEESLDMRGLRDEEDGDIESYNSKRTNEFIKAVENEIQVLASWREERMGTQSDAVSVLNNTGQALSHRQNAGQNTARSQARLSLEK